MVDFRKCPECGAYVEGPDDIVVCEQCGKTCCYNCIFGSGEDLCEMCARRRPEEDGDE